MPDLAPSVLPPRALGGASTPRVAPASIMSPTVRLARAADDTGVAVLDRPRLSRRLATPRASVALVVAPAGYGKTSALRAWARQDARRFAWVAPAAGDDDPARLLASIVRAVDEVAALPPAVVRAATARDAADAGDPVRRLADALRVHAAPLVVVLDDAERFRRPEALDVARRLIAALGAPSMLVLASRAEPSLPVGRLRANGALLELRTQELALTPGETSVVLRRAGVALEPAEAAALHVRTEGWPAIVALAALVLRDADDRRAALERFAGDDRIVADYVREELLCGVTADQLDLLVRTSPLDELSGDLCDAVLVRSGSGRLLRDVAHAGAPLVARDRCEQHFRVHRVVRETLLAELHCADPAFEGDVHRRASAWYERHGDVRRAAGHALDAGDDDRVEQVLWRTVPAAAWQGRVDVVRRSLPGAPAMPPAGRPALAFAFAVASLAAGDCDDAERRLAAVRPHAADGWDAGLRELRAAAAVLSAAIGRAGLGRTVRDADRARALAEPGGPWHALAGFVGGAARQLSGDLEQGGAQLEEAARWAARDAPVLRVLCLAQLALSPLVRGDDDGMRPAALARAELERHALADHPMSALVLAVSAFAQAQAGDAGGARRDAAATRRLAEQLPAPPPWYEAELWIALARTELRLGDAAAARSLLSAASRALRRAPDAAVLRAWIDDAWARADTFAVEAVSPGSTLTTAELRVLRLLPSHLSFREIAGRLHISTNTVKTQAHSVYRKLDASSRSEAVTRARAVGLVDA